MLRCCAHAHAHARAQSYTARRHAYIDVAYIVMARVQSYTARRHAYIVMAYRVMARAQSYTARQHGFGFAIPESQRNLEPKRWYRSLPTNTTSHQGMCARMCKHVRRHARMRVQTCMHM